VIQGETIERFLSYIYTEISLAGKISALNENFSDHIEAIWGVKIYQKGKGNPPQNGHESITKCFHSTTKSKATHSY